MNWQDLTTEQQTKWNDLEEKEQGFLQIFKILMEKGKCPMCRFTFKTWNEFSFHYSSTHGIPEEVLVEQMRITGSKNTPIVSSIK